jgi:NTP pyrophosphatase (non-canonical NTP hydrolase)
MTDTAELRKLAEAATPGPWKTGRLGDLKMTHVVDFGEPPKAPYMCVYEGKPDTANMRGSAPRGVCHSDDGSSDANAAYIAAVSPDVLLALLGCLEAPADRVESQATINEWITSTFGETGSNFSVAARANQEMAELLMALAVDDDHPKAVEEAADIVIVLYRLAERRGMDLHAEIDRKMAINRARRWNVANGHGYHVKEPPPPSLTERASK